MNTAIFVVISVSVFLGIPTTCEATDHDFMIVSDLTNGTIYTGPIDTLNLQPIPLFDVQRPVAVSYDPVEQRVYWTDVDKPSINRAYLDGTGQEELLALSKLIGARSVPDGITVDPDNRHIYWTDAGLNRIERSNLDGSDREIIFDDNLGDPRAIVVDPPGGHIYWTDWGSNKKIERAKLDGSDREILIESDLLYPNGIDVDFEGQRVYWCDAGTNKIESSDLNGQDRQTNLFIQTPDIHPFAISIYNDSIYWTDWVLTKLVKAPIIGATAQVVGPALFQQAGGLHIHQEHDDSCSSNMCDNGSQCRQLPVGYQCACLPGFEGAYCEIDIDECSASPCANGGRCDDGIDSFTCTCSPGWTGDICDIDVDECASATPCHVNAQCHNTLGSFICQCQIPFVGDGYNTCSVRDNCNPYNPCQNGGSCTSLVGDFTCSCTDGYTGKTCDLAPPNPCLDRPCHNGATCTSSGTAFICRCLDGYSGDLCETEINECASVPCQSGGTCHDDTNQFRCDCKDGYQGPMCETHSLTGCPHPGNLDNGYIVSDGSKEDTYPPGHRLVYVCEEGFELEGSKALYCQTDFMWSHDVPVCVEDIEDGVPQTAIFVGGGAVGLVILILVVVLVAVCLCKSRNDPNILEVRRNQQPLPKPDSRPFNPTVHSPQNEVCHPNPAYERDPRYAGRIGSQSGIYDEIPDDYYNRVYMEPDTYDRPTTGKYDRPPSRLPPNPPPYEFLRHFKKSFCAIARCGKS